MSGMLIALIAALVGSWGLLLALLYFVVNNPEKVERIAGWFLRFFAWGDARIRRRSITLSLQGRINTYGRFVDMEAEGTMPFNMRLEFVKEVDRAQFEPDDETVIVRIRDRIDDDLNLVHAMLVFCTIGVIPRARPYLATELNGAIDITMTRKLLHSLKHHSALQYLQDEVVPAEAAQKPGLVDYCRTLDLLDELGILTRVVLSDIRDFGATVETRYPDSHHAQEAAKYLEYVEQVATKEVGEELQQKGHHGRYITTAFAFIGSAEKMTFTGESAYTNHLKWLRDHGYRKVYLWARGDPQERRSYGIQMAERVAASAEREKVATIIRSEKFHAIAQDGTNRPNILIELRIIPPLESSDGSMSLRSDRKPRLGEPPNPIRRH